MIFGYPRENDVQKSEEGKGTSQSKKGKRGELGKLIPNSFCHLLSLGCMKGISMALNSTVPDSSPSLVNCYLHACQCIIYSLSLQYFIGKTEKTIISLQQSFHNNNACKGNCRGPRP